MNKLQEIEIEYNNKLQQAKQEENYGKIINLFYDLKVLRKIYKKGKFCKTISG